MHTFGPNLMKALLALGLFFGLVACSGSDFAGSNARKSLKLGANGGDGADVGDCSPDAACDTDTGNNPGGGGSDDDCSPDAACDDSGIDGADSGADGEIDADGDSGSTDSDSGEDDVGLDSGEFNAQLRDPLKLKMFSSDEASEIFVQYKKKNGDFSDERSVKFNQDENVEKEIPGVCRKKDNGTGEMVLKIRWLSTEPGNMAKHQVTGIAANARKSGGSGSTVKILADLDGCGGGTCLDPGEDNEIELKCPKFTMKVEGF